MDGVDTPTPSTTTRGYTGRGRSLRVTDTGGGTGDAARKPGRVWEDPED